MTERPALDAQISAAIVYFHVDETEIDVDNVIKPILDALKGHIYVDDRLLDQVLSRRTRLRGLTVRNASPLLAASLAGRSDFVYVAIAAAPDHEMVP